MLWTCFDDETEQCGTCIKCVRTQLNILCAERIRQIGDLRSSTRSDSPVTFVSINIASGIYAGFGISWIPSMTQ